jgi:hypothetical protein
MLLSFFDLRWGFGEQPTRQLPFCRWAILKKQTQRPLDMPH